MNATQDTRALPTEQRWVLLTDDSQTVCKLLTRVVNRMGYSAVELENFLDLPRLIRDVPPALVVLDLERPGGLSGAAIGRFIRQYQAQLIPIVIFSSLPEEKRRSISHEIHAQGSVGKQQSVQALIAVMKTLLDAAPASASPGSSGADSGRRRS